MASIQQADYQTARFVARAISALGWVVVALGALVAVFPLLFGRTDQFNGSVFLGAIAVGIVIVAIGIVQVATGQLLRATVDTADNTRQMLEIMQR